MAVRVARASVPTEQTWDLEGLYPTTEAWEADLAQVEALLPELDRYRGRLGEGADRLNDCLRLSDQILQVARRVIWFASNRLAEDQADPHRQGLQSRAQAMEAKVAAGRAFIAPEILAMPDGTVEGYLDSSPPLQLYRLKLMDLLEEKQHMLSAEGEAIVAQFSELLDAPFEIWQNTTNADIAFDPITDERGETVPMSASALSRYLHSPDRAVRKAAYESAARAYDHHKRTITAAMAAAVKRDVILARLRQYPSALTAALAPVHLPESLYRNLLEVAEGGAVHYRRYMELRRRELGVEQLMPYDLLAPLDTELQSDIDFHEAFALVRTALEPLGGEYQAVLDRACHERWVDWADNAGKAVGAYSSGCYGYHPVILLNWQGKMADSFTLAHELGHAVHSIFSTQSQPYPYSGYNLFLAEMASTTNEILLARHLLRVSTDRALRRYVLTRALGTLTANFFGGTTMAAFQLAAHEMVERGEPLTYESLTDLNSSILRRFYGDAVTITPDGMAATWLRPPHHFLNFYGYQYATGVSAAAAFAGAILEEGEPAIQRYLSFLRAGSSQHSIDILKEAGIDMTSREPVVNAVALFADLVDQLERS